MKKLIYVFLCITAIVFASCGNRVANTQNSDSLEVVDTLGVDTLIVDTI